jgi:thiol:disulfide interchange protein
MSGLDRRSAGFSGSTILLAGTLALSAALLAGCSADVGGETASNGADQTGARTVSDASSESADIASDAVGDALFTDLSYDRAMKKATDEGRMLIVKATAVWCKPCKEMDRTTWVDEQVASFVRDNGVAYKLDVDKESAIAQRLGIQAMPTIVVFENGEETARIVGYQGPEDMLTWLRNVHGGAAG